jgi:hypothetical protein
MSHAGYDFARFRTAAKKAGGMDIRILERTLKVTSPFGPIGVMGPSLQGYAPYAFREYPERSGGKTG